VAEGATRTRLRPDPGLLLAGAASILLFLLMFRGWFGLKEAAPVAEGAVGVGLGRSFDAWVSFAWIDLFLLAAVAVVLLFLGMAFAGVRLSFRPGPVLVGLGLACFLLVAYRLILPPWADAQREAAAFFALLCCLAIAGGGQLSFLISSGRIRASSPRTSPAKGSSPRAASSGGSSYRSSRGSSPRASSPRSSTPRGSGRTAGK
jgi:hypothetical protein